MAIKNVSVAESIGAAQAAAGKDFEPVNHWFLDQTLASWKDAAEMGEANKAQREAYEATKAAINK